MKLLIKPVPGVHLAAFFVTALVLGSSSPSAADTKPLEPPKKLWNSVVSLDLTLTRGNSDTFLATTTINTQRKWAMDELLLGGGAGYGNTTVKDSTGKETTNETQDYLKGFGQFNHLFSKRFYAGLRIEGLHDNIADINYRFTLSPIAGYYFIKETNTFLSGEAGPSLVYEELGGDTQTYMGLRVAERFEHKLATKARIWHNLEWIPQVDDFDNWILNAEVGVSAPVYKALDVRLVAQDTYNNKPASERLKNDLKLLAGVGYRF
jgi:putative salt-induced outer membrane protein YdiY